MTGRSLNLFALFALLWTIGCEEEPKAKPDDRGSPSATARAPAPSASAAGDESESAKREEKKKKKKKTAEDCGDGPQVAIDDKAVEEELRKKLQKPTGDITRADLGKLKSLNLTQAKLTELDPCIFLHTKNLKELFLGPGEIDDLAPLAGLTKLESLRASINPIEDLEPLVKLTHLDRLDLGRTRVEDLKPLAGLTALTELALDDTPVSDLGPLAKLEKLERLSVQRTRVKDFSPIKDMKSLKFLYIAGTPAPDIQVLAPLRSGGTKIIDQ